MNTNTAAEHDQSIDWESLGRERSEFAKTKPLPALADQLPDIQWFHQHRYDPLIQKHRGDYVAILNGQVVGTGSDWLKLELECAKKFDVHPSRVIVRWVDDGRDLHIELLEGSSAKFVSEGVDVQDLP